MQNLTIESGAFEGLRRDFNGLLTNIVMRMEEHEVDNAEMNIKLSIGLAKDYIGDPTGIGDMREITVPMITHKITTKMQMQNTASGALPCNYELVWDGKDYMLRNVAEQCSIWEDGDED